MQERATLFFSQENVNIDDSEFCSNIKTRYQTSVEAQTFSPTKNEYSSARVSELEIKSQMFFNSGIVENGKVWTGKVSEGQATNEIKPLSDIVEDTDDCLSQKHLVSLVEQLSKRKPLSEDDKRVIEIIKSKVE